MDNQLPTEFDLIVVGTGIIESILSAAASRIGKTVLHIDRNDYYGGQWASFNLKALLKYSPTTKVDKHSDINFLPIGNDVFNIQDFQYTWHVPEKINPVIIENQIDNLEICDTPIAGKVNQEFENETTNSELQNRKKAEEISQTQSHTEVKHTQESLLKDSKRFNIDLSPKLHFARGSFVELLISSNIARYAEYRSVSRVLTWLNGQLEVVPCSRSDVFANNKVSVIEKRMLMKLLTSLDKNVDVLKEQNTTLYEFLKGRKLSPNLVHYVLHAMSGSTEETPLAEGIANIKRFLNSLGRFGKTPFLFSMYGSGETTQAFCRLSAVFGGIFALNQASMTGIKVEDNKVKILLNGDQEIKAEHFIFSAENSPEEFVKSVKINEKISRAILITDRSIMTSEQEHLTLLIYPPEMGKNIVTIIEMGSLTGTCPKDVFLVHLTSRQVVNPQEDFQLIINNLFVAKDGCEEIPTKPKILWSCYFSLPDSADVDLNANLPENLYFCSGPDLDLDYDLNIKKARDIFAKMYPDLEFLPRAPDAEEIIIEGGNAQDSEAFTENSDTNDGNNVK